jgi:hypothetical protein
MLTTEAGITMLVREVQWVKAIPPMLVTLDGTDVFLHPEISVLVAVSMMQLLPLPSL